MIKKTSKSSIVDFSPLITYKVSRNYDSINFNSYFSIYRRFF